ncbi:hypothetical protein B0H10DRAFT_1799704 [Mycena sp. CBHHK59/15]|nr:hypothetical protein B0H10DRAFT_1799704 [Mycena sp. CBHHK59/15]
MHDLPDDHCGPALARCVDLWFTDCGLVIQAGNMLYRISGEMLAAKSPVFADMLSFPQPEDPEQIDGCPVVFVPDSSLEMTVFLKALLDYESFQEHPAQTDFDEICGVLRLSNKYLVEPLRKRALNHLTLHFSTTSLDCRPLPTSWEFRPNHLLPMILLAREVSALWILPVIFYQYCEHRGPDQLLSGYKYRGSHLNLSAQDQVTCLSAMMMLRTQLMTDFLDFLWNSNVTLRCFRYGECITSRINARRVAETRRHEHFPFDTWSAQDTSGINLCPTCAAALQNAHQDAQSALWNRLPELFKLPSWDELEKMRVAAFSS